MELRRVKLALIECRQENTHLRYIVKEMTTPPADWQALFDEHGIHLTIKESRMIARLTKQPGVLISYDHIRTAVSWDHPNKDASYNLASVYLCRIRKKLKAANFPAHIRTVPKRGLMWVNDGGPKSWLV